MIYTYAAKVTKVTDGDTFVCDIDLGFRLWNKDVKIRLLNYNAPENSGAEKAFGAVAKQVMTNLLLTRDITIRTVKSDSFGRYLGEVWLDNGVNLVDMLVADGFGINWDGKGTRPGFDMSASYPLKKIP